MYTTENGGDPRGDFVGAWYYTVSKGGRQIAVGEPKLGATDPLRYPFVDPVESERIWIVENSTLDFRKTYGVNFLFNPAPLTRVSIKTPYMQMILPHRTEVPGLRFSTTEQMHPSRIYNALQSFDCSIRRRRLPKRVQARDAKSYLVDGGWKLIEVRPSVEFACGTATTPPMGTATTTRPGAAADAVLLVGVHGRGAGEAEEYTGNSTFRAAGVVTATGAIEASLLELHVTVATTSLQL